MISEKTFKEIRSKKPDEWTPEFSEQVYQEIADHKAYITNLAKCTQSDARPLKDNVFKEYLKYTLQEIQETNPKHIIAFGNQVSSILL
jgi:uracil-DNA glycosylase